MYWLRVLIIFSSFLRRRLMRIEGDEVTAEVAELGDRDALNAERDDELAAVVPVGG
jgi:hypothetical protein